MEWRGRKIKEGSESEREKKNTMVYCVKLETTLIPAIFSFFFSTLYASHMVTIYRHFTT